MDYSLKTYSDNESVLRLFVIPHPHPIPLDVAHVTNSVIFLNILGVCKVRTYAGSAFQGRTIRVHTGFVSAMNRINSNANSCGVKV